VDSLPYRDADRLVNVFVENVQSGSVRGTFAFPEFIDLRDESDAFKDVIGTPRRDCCAMRRRMEPSSCARCG